MGISFSNIAKAAWGIFGKKAVGKAAVAEVNKIIDEVCQEYSVKDIHCKQLKKEMDELISYMAECILNDNDIDKDYVNRKIEGPISDTILKAAYSSNNGQNFLSDILNRLDDSTIDNFEKFFIMAGSKSGADYISLLRSVIKTLRDKVKEEPQQNNKEPYITYEPKVNAGSRNENLPSSKKSKTPVKVQNGMTDDEDQRFVDNLADDINSALTKTRAKGKLTPADVVDMTKLFIDKSAEVAKFCEEQKTKRTLIRAQTQVAIHQIDTVRDFLKDYLERTFDERRRIFDKEFEIVDKCLATGDTQTLAVSLNSITELAKSSPFKALADLGSVRKTLENKGTFDI